MRGKTRRWPGELTSNVNFYIRKREIVVTLFFPYRNRARKRQRRLSIANHHVAHSSSDTWEGSAISIVSGRASAKIIIFRIWRYGRSLKPGISAGIAHGKSAEHVGGGKGIMREAQFVPTMASPWKRSCYSPSMKPEKRRRAVRNEAP